MVVARGSRGVAQFFAALARMLDAHSPLQGSASMSDLLACDVQISRCGKSLIMRQGHSSRVLIGASRLRQPMVIPCSAKGSAEQ